MNNYVMPIQDILNLNTVATPPPSQLGTSGIYNAQYTANPQMQPTSGNLLNFSMLPAQMGQGYAMQQAAAHNGMNPMQKAFGYAKGAISDVLDFDTPERGWMNTLFGDKENLGIIPATTDAVKSVLGGLAGIKQMGLAQESLDFQRATYNTNLKNQITLTNNSIRERAARRHAENPAQFETADKVVDKYGVKA